MTYPGPPLPWGPGMPPPPGTQGQLPVVQQCSGMPPLPPWGSGVLTPPVPPVLPSQQYGVPVAPSHVPVPLPLVAPSQVPVPSPLVAPNHDYSVPLQGMVHPPARTPSFRPDNYINLPGPGMPAPPVGHIGNTMPWPPPTGHDQMLPSSFPPNYLLYPPPSLGVGPSTDTSTSYVKDTYSSRRHVDDRRSGSGRYESTRHKEHDKHLDDRHYHKSSLSDSSSSHRRRDDRRSHQHESHHLREPRRRERSSSDRETWSSDSRERRTSRSGLRTSGHHHSRSLTPPRSSMDAQKRSLTPPRSSMDAQKRSLTPPRSSMDAQKRSLMPPRSSMDAQERSLTPPRSSMDAQKRSRYSSRREEPSKRSESRHRSPAHRKSPSKRSSTRDQPKKKEEASKDKNVSDTPAWIRCAPADLYFSHDANKPENLCATKKMLDLEDKFDKEIIQRAKNAEISRPPYIPPKRPPSSHHHHHHHDDESDISSDSTSNSDSDLDLMMELNRKKNHPCRLHEELWYNDPGEMNDGVLCRCSLKSRKIGIRHNIYRGEEVVPSCDVESNNLDRLYHYCITMSPPTNFLTKHPTIIDHDNHEYIFEGFSLFSHSKLDNIPLCKVIRFNIEYTIHFYEDRAPENFTVRSLDLFTHYLFHEILELLDIDWKGQNAADNHCNRFHLMPRFARDLPDNGKEILSMNDVLNFLMKSAKPLLEKTDLETVLKYDDLSWQSLVDKVRGMIVTNPGMKPSSVRIDQLDKDHGSKDEIAYPLIVHFGIRPAQLSYVGDPEYQKLWHQYVKYKHLLASKPKVTYEDKQKLQLKENKLTNHRLKFTLKREVTVDLSSEGFVLTGIRSDICQHAMLMPVLLSHLRLHQSLSVLENILDYKFNDRSLLQLALTHTSYRVNFGTNPDHARNSLSNCGTRLLEWGNRNIHYVNTRKRGINVLIDIMSRMGHKDETTSEIPHNERLEFLGDAVVEFISSVHLFYMFPWLEEGGLTTYRAAIVQNQHLAVLAKHLHLQDFMLYAHGPDLCRESDLKHAMANCFEALMGALFIDGGIELTDRIFAGTLFQETDLLGTWTSLPVHPLQDDEPNGDRHWIESSPTLQKLLRFEESTGIQFDHIRLLAKAYTLRNVGYNNLTLGHNQRLEFLGDTVLQLVASEYLFKHFPDHHEGHLSLLRSSLVNKVTQSIVCDDLGMTEYVIFTETRGGQLDMKTKEKADLLEAFIGSLYVDKGLEFCQVFCNVCFFPRLKDFILNQDWNDPKSQLQQCCLTLRELDGGEPDIPLYKVIQSTGPTNTRRYVVAVYFHGQRLSTGSGHSIQQAEMSAATNALNERSELFPILSHQKRFLERRHQKRTRSGQSKDNSQTTSE